MRRLAILRVFIPLLASVWLTLPVLPVAVRSTGAPAHGNARWRHSVNHARAPRAEQAHEHTAIADRAADVEVATFGLAPQRSATPSADRASVTDRVRGPPSPSRS